MDYSHYQHLLVGVDDGVAVVTINRPEVFNATNNVLHRELTQIWGDIDRDPAVRVAIVTGAGDQAFSAGGDLGDIEARAALPIDERFDALVALMKEAEQVVYSIVHCEKIIISAINGVAVGAGLAVALMADISLIAEEARLTDGHARLGVAAGDHAAMIWPLLCGMAKAKYYLLTCEFIDGREAERIGLVSKAVPRAELMPEAQRIARQLADGPQTALRFTKRSLNQWLKLGGITAFDYSAALEIMGFFSPDPAEGARAIIEKRAANFPSAANS
ncbi:MAG TPA: enoyl-CoA hydratase/isomerase family protein [Tepidiformaceae bacterium]|nr:enoyl-CoA hydratase/isomerase family protein [Tepidiformaceae bacterium]